MQRREGVIEDTVRYITALGDALGLVERPVNAEIDSALAVFLFGLRERREIARHVRPHLAMVVFGDSVEFVRHKSESSRLPLFEEKSIAIGATHNRDEATIISARFAPVARPGARVSVSRQNRPTRSFPPQRHYDFLVMARQDHPAVFDSF